MGEKTRETLRLQFDKRLRLEFHGARITSDAGLPELYSRDAMGCPGVLNSLDNRMRWVYHRH